MFNAVAIYRLTMIAALFSVCLSNRVVAQEEKVAVEAPQTLVQELSDPEISDAVFKLRILHLTNAELADMASQWLEATRSTVKEAADVNILVSTKPDQVDDEMRTKLEEKMKKRNRKLRKLDLILDEWAAKGAPEEKVDEYKNYAIAVLRTEFRSTDIRTIFSYLRHWIVSPDGGLRVLFWFLIFIGSLFVLNLLALLISASFRRSLLKRRKFSSLLRDFLSRTAYWFIFAIGTALILSSFGVNLTPLVAAFGGASFVIGFATQSTLSNLASGLLLLVNRPFDVGDQVTIAGVSGRVESVTTVSTVIRGDDMRKTVVPNTKVWDSVIINEGRSDQASP